MKYRLIIMIGLLLCLFFAFAALQQTSEQQNIDTIAIQDVASSVPFVEGAALASGRSAEMEVFGLSESTIVLAVLTCDEYTKICKRNDSHHNYRMKDVLLQSADQWIKYRHRGRAIEF